MITQLLTLLIYVHFLFMSYSIYCTENNSQ